MSVEEFGRGRTAIITSVAALVALEVLRHEDDDRAWEEASFLRRVGSELRGTMDEMEQREIDLAAEAACHVFFGLRDDELDVLLQMYEKHLRWCGFGRIH